MAWRALDCGVDAAQVVAVLLDEGANHMCDWDGELDTEGVLGEPLTPGVRGVLEVRGPARKRVALFGG